MPADHQCFIEGDVAEEAGDFNTARASFELGAALGDPYCWSRLGLMFDKGVGCDVDKATAMRCYRRAWQARDVVAANNIAVLYRETGNRRAMFQWFKRAADAGDDGAFIRLAECYLTGTGTRRSSTRAAACLDRAAEGGSLSDAEREEAELLLAKISNRAPTC
jgi:TPR repeat protein